MTNSPWNFSILSKGFTAVWVRSSILLTTFFMSVDLASRFLPQATADPYTGAFIKGGVCSALAWIVSSPAEVAKNQIQRSGGKGSQSILKHCFDIVQERGVGGLYRGLLPNIFRTLISNTCAMYVFNACQQARRE